MKLRRYFPLTALLLVLLLLATPAFAATLPPLGTAASFGVLGGTTVTNTGSTQVIGDLGVSPGSAVTGFPPGTVSGSIHRGNAVALQAQTDVTIAYNNAAGQPCDFDLTGQDLGGMTLVPAVYCFSSSAQLTGQLTLDAQGIGGSVFIFKIGSTLTTASAASVLLINGAQACNVFWQVGSSATLGTSTTFKGNILALTSITLNTGASSAGGLYARNGAVTLGTNLIQACGQASTPTPTSTAGAAATSTPVPLATNTVRPVTTRPPPPPPSDTPVPPPSDTPVPLPTGTTVPPPDTPVPLPTDTLVPQPSSTPQPSDTPVSVATGTAVPNNTSVPVSTGTPGSVETGTPGPASTGTPVIPVGLPPTGEHLDWGSRFFALALLLLALGFAFRRVLTRRTC